MDKKEKYVEAFIYFKSQKVAPVKGNIVENEKSIQFFHGEFAATCQRKNISLIIKDDIDNLLEKYKEFSVRGFELFMESGTTAGFNGWAIQADENIKEFLSNQGDHISIYEPIDYIKSGPEDPRKNPGYQEPEQREEVVESEDKG